MLTNRSRFGSAVEPKAHPQIVNLVDLPAAALQRDLERLARFPGERDARLQRFVRAKEAKRGHPMRIDDQAGGHSSGMGKVGSEKHLPFTGGALSKIKDGGAAR